LPNLHGRLLCRPRIMNPSIAEDEGHQIPIRLTWTRSFIARQDSKGSQLSPPLLKLRNALSLRRPSWLPESRCSKKSGVFHSQLPKWSMYLRLECQGVSLLTLPRTLYYCLGNIGENFGSIRSVQQDLRGNVPFASGLVLAYTFALRTCDSTSTRSRRTDRRRRQQ
jgi:hypothetical protein